jgi:penicillin-binding protein 1A
MEDLTADSGTENNTDPSTQRPALITRPAQRIIDADAAYDMANILRDVVQVGTARAALKLGRSDLAGKTGTTNDAKDAWFSGFQPSMVAVAWVGFDQPKSLGRREYGGVAALPIWTDFMGKALADVPEQWITRKNHTQRAERSASDLIDSTIDSEEAPATPVLKRNAPPMAVIIQRPAPPPRPTVTQEPSSIDPNLPVTRLTPNIAQTGSYREPTPSSSNAGSTSNQSTVNPRVSPDDIF